MAVCPACKSIAPDGASECPVCGSEINPEPTGKHEWIIVGVIGDKVSADFARETLNSYDIPAVIFSKAGVFGNGGLPMNSIYGGTTDSYEVSIPEDFYEETVELLNTILGNNWIRAEE